MNRAERRRRNEIKSIKRLKKHWSRWGIDRIYDRKNKVWVYVHTLSDAIEIEHSTNGRLFGWFNAVKKGNRCHHSDSYTHYENKRMDNKEKREAKKQMELDIYQAYIDNDPWEWENHCGVCDNFPGDKFHDPSPYIFHECPRKGKITADTCWKNFNCPYFWD